MWTQLRPQNLDYRGLKLCPFPQPVSLLAIDRYSKDTWGLLKNRTDKTCVIDHLLLYLGNGHLMHSSYPLGDEILTLFLLDYFHCITDVQ